MKVDEAKAFVPVPESFAITGGIPFDLPEGRNGTVLQLVGDGPKPRRMVLVGPALYTGGKIAYYANLHATRDTGLYRLVDWRSVARSEFGTTPEYISALRGNPEALAAVASMVMTASIKQDPSREWATDEVRFVTRDRRLPVGSIILADDYRPSMAGTHNRDGSFAKAERIPLLKSQAVRAAFGGVSVMSPAERAQWETDNSGD